PALTCADGRRRAQHADAHPLPATATAAAPPHTRGRPAVAARLRRARAAARPVVPGGCGPGRQSPDPWSTESDPWSTVSEHCEQDSDSRTATAGRRRHDGGGMTATDDMDVDPQSELLELEIGPVAHGGWCVARHDGRVVFVRHTLPAERVRARVVETTNRFWRAEAVEVLRASPDRVEPPCPYARPGRCGGCD